MQVAAQRETDGREPFGLDSLFLEHQGRVFRAAYRLTGNVQDAEDVLQTVFLRLAQQEQAAPANVSSYLYRAAVNASIDLLRGRRGRTMVGLDEAGLALRSPETPERAQQDAELREWLRGALAGLPAREGEVFALRHLEGVANKDIARMLGLSRVAVAVTLHRARRRLQGQLRRMKAEGRP